MKLFTLLFATIGMSRNTLKLTKLYHLSKNHSHLAIISIICTNAMPARREQPELEEECIPENLEKRREFAKLNVHSYKSSTRIISKRN